MKNNMQLELNSPALDIAWFRAAVRECVRYGEHGQMVEIDDYGRTVCFNCQGRL
jgi:hypothetical protein